MKQSKSSIKIIYNYSKIVKRIQIRMYLRLHTCKLILSFLYLIMYLLKQKLFQNTNDIQNTYMTVLAVHLLFVDKLDATYNQW